MIRAVSDPEIEQLEADLHRSRFEKWDVETFLADRHRAKADALTNPKSPRVGVWRLFRELTDPVFVYVGWVALLNLWALWMLGALPG
jgi:hypothetical protein